jgi:hypothetical protein
MTTIEKGARESALSPINASAKNANVILAELPDSWIGRWRRKQITAAMAHPNWSQLISSEQATVALAIAHTAPGRACDGSQGYLARRLGVVRKTVNEHLGKAVRLGILTCIRRIVNHRRTTNLYSLAVECFRFLTGAVQRPRRRSNGRAELDNQPSRAAGYNAVREPFRALQALSGSLSSSGLVVGSSGGSGGGKPAVVVGLGGGQTLGDLWRSDPERYASDLADIASDLADIETNGVEIEHEQNGNHESSSEAGSGTPQSPGPSRRAVARQRDAGYRGGHPRSERGRDAACSSGANRLCHRLGGLRIRTFPLHLARLRLSQKAGFPGPLAMMLRARRVARRRLSDESRIPNLAPFDSVARLVR